MGAPSILTEDDRADVISMLAGDIGVQLSVASLDQFIDADTQCDITVNGATDTVTHEWLLDLLVRALLDRPRWPSFGEDISDAAHDQFLLDLRAAAARRGWVVADLWPLAPVDA